MTTPLPPNPDGQNGDRAEAAETALQAHRIQRPDSSSESTLSDLLTDLMHWQDRQHDDCRSFDLLLRRAVRAYRDETQILE